MKKYFLSLVLACMGISPVIASDTYFRPGMTWVEERRSDVTPWDLPFQDVLYLEQGDEDGVYELYTLSETEAEPSLTALVKTEGEKVFMRSVKAGDTQNWYLVYDFGLLPGESCDVYYPYWKTQDGIPWKYNLSCLEIREQDPEFDGVDVMVMKENLSDEYSDQGYWIKGIGATRGVLENCRFEAVGGSSRIQQAIFNGESLYSTPSDMSSCFFPGVSWLTEYESDANPNVSPFSYRNYTIMGTKDDMYLYSSNPMSDATVIQTVAQIRTEGGKVYFRLPTDATSEWYLMYDFGLRVGSGDYFYDPDWLLSDGTPSRSYLVCREKVLYNSRYKGWTTMTMEEYADETLEEIRGTGTWIRGLGAEAGVLENIGFDLDGRNSKMLEAKIENNVIYSSRSGNSGVNDISADFSVNVNGLDVTVSGLDGYSEGAVYGLEGTLICSFTGSDRGSISFSLPSSGLYILRIGSVTRKLLIK